MSGSQFEMWSAALHWGVGGLLAVAVLFFIIQFVLPGVRVGRQLKSARGSIDSIKARGQVLDLDEVLQSAMGSPQLQHCWTEYRDTLHPQKRADEFGSLQVVRWRATALAQGFFTEQSLVDGPLRTEFYKHLPGMLTGLGIIGTFTGLILGLQGFQVTDDANQVRQSLATLIQSVGGAFLVSGAAILLAMLVTLVEKALINKLYTATESLSGVIDSLFDAGAGEEYLQRLVEASETSATQALQMKESLVTDLKQVLTELTQQQIATMTATSQQLGQSIATSLTEGLKEPLQRISNAVETVGGNQGDAVNRMLTDVLSAFSSKMEGMFGGQLSGMNEMLQQTARTIETASQRFDQLAGRIEQAGTGATDAMAKRMEELMAQMRDRQAESDAQMAAFINKLQQDVSKGQSDAAELTLQMMRELSESTGALVQGLQQQSHAAQQEHSTRQAELAERAHKLLATHGEQVEDLIDAVDEAAKAMRESVDKLQLSTQSNVDKMAQGAERLHTTSTRLADNLDKLRQVSDGLTDSADGLVRSAVTVDAALKSTERVLQDQRTVRDAIAAMVNDLRSTVEAAKREAGLTQQLVSSLGTASERLLDAQRNAEGYLEKVSEVLGTAHAEFASNVQTTLRSSNAAFHQELAQAVNYLKGAIQDLGDVLDNVPARG
ncbi:hypothetical protein AQPW35_42350 [Rubrivivax pictus]|uniref:MotA/TolQ/ExbB proton channel domain-containing protein n=2 Tax=Pseudaquabacterium pictum TaxID=2315236 RepID=A0A480AUE0_9BURK|nr:hypothetical protein AQPW35_42350 [Rubrivivax pictus]